MKLRLIGITNPKVWEFDQDIIKVGRLPSSHLRIEDDPEVSRMHAVIEFDGSGGFLVIDLGSAAGTVVNDKKVNKGPVLTGDVLKFGKTTFMAEVGNLLSIKLPDPQPEVRHGEPTGNYREAPPAAAPKRKMTDVPPFVGPAKDQLDRLLWYAALAWGDTCDVRIGFSLSKDGVRVYLKQKRRDGNVIDQTGPSADIVVASMEKLLLVLGTSKVNDERRKLGRELVTEEQVERILRNAFALKQEPVF